MFWKGCADLLNRRHVAALGIEKLSYDGFPTERTPVAIACRLKAVQNTDINLQWLMPSGSLYQWPDVNKWFVTN
jgi:hypothetical protein